MMSRKSIAILVILLVLAIIVSFYIDAEVVTLASKLRSSILDNFFIWVAYLGSEVILFIFLTALFLIQRNKKEKRWIIPLWFSLFLTSIAGFFLKLGIGRLRPYQTGIVPVVEGMAESSHLIWNFSFPSFHTMFVFSALPILWIKFPRFRYAWLSFAILISFSRIYLGLHFLSDVIAGGLIGYLVGEVIVKIEKKKKVGENIYNRIYYN